jgi:hypothetical protein
MSDEAKREITFEYKISPNYTVLAVTGVYGGLNSQGQVIMNLFNERHPIPKTQTFAVLDDGTLDRKPISEVKNQNVIRDVLVAVSISPENARLLADWLNAKADQYDEILKRKQPDVDTNT